MDRFSYLAGRIATPLRLSSADATEPYARVTRLSFHFDNLLVIALAAAHIPAGCAIHGGPPPRF